MGRSRWSVPAVMTQMTQMTQPSLFEMAMTPMSTPDTISAAPIPSVQREPEYGIEPAGTSFLVVRYLDGEERAANGMSGADGADIAGHRAYRPIADPRDDHPWPALFPSREAAERFIAALRQGDLKRLPKQLTKQARPTRRAGKTGKSREALAHRERLSA